MGELWQKVYCLTYGETFASLSVITDTTGLLLRYRNANHAIDSGLKCHPSCHGMTLERNALKMSVVVNYSSTLSCHINTFNPHNE